MLFLLENISLKINATVLKQKKKVIFRFCRLSNIIQIKYLPEDVLQCSHFIFLFHVGK